MSKDTRTDDASGRRHEAGWFDIRNIIGALLGIYGIVLLLTFALGGSGRTASGQSHKVANLWTGLALLAAGIVFLVWAKARPTVVDEAELARQKAEAEKMGGSPSA